LVSVDDVLDRVKTAGFARRAIWASTVITTYRCHSQANVVYNGPLIPPSLRMRQKWIAISTVTITG
jgi:hypothetical protein